MDTVNDVLGNSISEGDTVAFAANSNRSAHLRIGTVAEITEGCVRIKYKIGGINRGIRQAPNNVVVVKGGDK